MVRPEPDARAVFTVFLVWVATGTAFIMLEDGVNFVTGLYFSTSAMSTAGLYAPTVEEDTGHIKASTAWFVFAATGVPFSASRWDSSRV